MLTPYWNAGTEVYADHKFRLIRALEDGTGKPVLVRLLASSNSLLEAARFRQGFELARRLEVEGLAEHRALIESPAHGPVQVLADEGDEILAGRIATGQPFDLEEALRLAVTLTEILGRLHNQRIIHKDIHPGNISWSPAKDRCRLLGLNIATLLSSESQSLVYPGTLEGRLEYVSPEQTGRMNRQIDYRSDFYSLGPAVRNFQRPAALPGRRPDAPDPLPHRPGSRTAGRIATRRSRDRRRNRNEAVEQKRGGPLSKRLRSALRSGRMFALPAVLRQRQFLSDRAPQRIREIRKPPAIVRPG